MRKGKSGEGEGGIEGEGGEKIGGKVREKERRKGRGGELTEIWLVPPEHHTYDIAIPQLDLKKTKYHPIL